MAKPRCKKCGSTALTVEGCRTLLGSRAVRCLHCGWHLFDPRDLTRAMRLTVEDFAPRGACRKVEWGQCKVVGCTEKIDLSQNGSGLCQRHQQQMRGWKASKRTLPAPLELQADGSYVVIRERQVRGAKA